MQFHQERTMESTQQQPQQQPSKQQVRDYMARRQADHTPPPAPAEVRRQLGWGLSGAAVQECFR